MVGPELRQGGRMRRVGRFRRTPQCRLEGLGSLGYEGEGEGMPAPHPYMLFEGGRGE